MSIPSPSNIHQNAFYTCLQDKYLILDINFMYLVWNYIWPNCRGRSGQRLHPHWHPRWLFYHVWCRTQRMFHWTSDRPHPPVSCLSSTEVMYTCCVHYWAVQHSTWLYTQADFSSQETLHRDTCLNWFHCSSSKVWEIHF